MSFSLGFFFLQAAYQENRGFMVTTVPGRFVAAVVFGFHWGKWSQVAVYEAVWGVVSSAAFLWWWDLGCYLEMASEGSIF